MKTQQQKQDEAKVRQAAYDALTPQQKLDRLDKMFGKGQGAFRERQKLATRLEKLNRSITPEMVAELRNKRPEQFVSPPEKQPKVSGRQNKQKPKKSQQ